MCPKCGKSVLYSCSNCIARRNEGIPIINSDLLLEIYVDAENGIFECPYCHKIYNYYESEEYEWVLFTQTDEHQKFLLKE